VLARRNSNTLWGKYSAEVDSSLSRKVDLNLKKNYISSWFTGSNLNGFSHGGGEGGIDHLYSELSTRTQK
jgi:hypothetical protein